MSNRDETENYFAVNILQNRACFVYNILTGSHMTLIYD